MLNLEELSDLEILKLVYVEDLLSGMSKEEALERFLGMARVLKEEADRRVVE